jgi:flagellar M-ring protein FliF
MAEGVGNIIEVFKAMPAGKRISFLITFAIVVGGFIALFTYTNRPTYRTLFSNMDQTEAAKVTAKLDEKGVKYIHSADESTIKVPDDMVHGLRMEMVNEGIAPKGGSIGYEIFDDVGFGTTEFVLKINQQRAIKGVLERTIEGSPDIDDANVLITPAGDSIFAENEKPAKATVSLRLHPGSRLNKRQLQGILAIVEGAVDGLKAENISIVDMEGGILLKGDDKNGIGTISSDQFEHQRKVAADYEKKIVSMLEPVVGANKVVAQVSVDVDYKIVNQTEENYDPDSQVISSESREKETDTNGNRIAQGSPDLLNQGVQTGSELSGTSGNLYEKETSNINYLINKAKITTINESGDIQRLSASVIIDGPYETTTDEQGNTVKTFTGYDRKRMKDFENNIKDAIGFDSERGDQLTVTNYEFPTELQSMAETPAEGSDGWMNYLKKGSKPILNVLMIALFFLVAIKPFKKWLNQTSEFVSTRALPQVVETDDLSSTAPDMQARQNEKLRLLEATKQNPDVAADIIKTWLNEVT